VQELGPLEFKHHTQHVARIFAGLALGKEVPVPQ
jgi:hypothetical protein